MPKTLHHRLLEKGWTEEEVNKVHEILFSEEKREKHAKYVSSSHPILYWAGLLVAIIGNFVLTVALVPFLMILNSMQVYIILGVVGFGFGLLFHVILKDIEHVDQRHHIAAGVFTPLLALVIVFSMTTVANQFNELISNNNMHSPLGIGVVYVFCFTLPYLFYKAKDLAWERKNTSQPPTYEQNSGQ